MFLEIFCSWLRNRSFFPTVHMISNDITKIEFLFTQQHHV